MTESRNPVDIAVDFIRAFARHDMPEVARHLADDVTFESPRATIRGAESVLAEVGQFAQVVTDVKILATVGDESQAMIMYDLKTTPFGTLRAVDRLVVRDGRIISDALVFDTYALRQATGG
jgi:limonene-1,2-epoxide hydrolase